MINLELRQQVNANTKAYRYIDRRIVTAVPATGELFNYDGHPYIVIDRGWAMSPNGPELWCYLTLLPATERVTE